MKRFFSLKNIFFQIINIKRFLIILIKVKRRFFDEKRLKNNKKLIDWYEKNITDIENFCKNIDAALWEETILETKKIEKFADEKLRNIPYNLGGGGAYQLLYFITRYKKPEIIVETGVAAGYSSFAFLKAIKNNNLGKLYSSDFPYFRYPNPEKFIGIVVEEYLKDNWELFIEGDENNLKEILIAIKKDRKKGIDLFHYDSDKSYSGRKRCFKIIDDYINKNSVILMDDIQDNGFFYDYILKNKGLLWKIFKFQGKYVGLIGRIN